MTLGPDLVGFESRLDALGRAMETEAATPAPSAFVGAVRRRGRAIMVRKAGAGAAGALALMVLVVLAQHNRGPIPVRAEAAAPTFASLRTVADVDAGPQMKSSVAPSPPVARAGERPEGDVGRELVEFK